MTDLSKLAENRGSPPLMAIPCPWCAEVALCTFLSLESLQTRIFRGSQLCISWDPMNGILLSWTFLTHVMMGSLCSPMTPLRGLGFDPTFDVFGDYTHRAIQTHSILDDSSQQMTPFPTIRANQHVFRTNKHVFNKDTPDYENLRPYFGWVNVDTNRK